MRLTIGIDRVVCNCGKPCRNANVSRSTATRHAQVRRIEEVIEASSFTSDDNTDELPPAAGFSSPQPEGREVQTKDVEALLTISRSLRATSLAVRLISPDNLVLDDQAGQLMQTHPNNHDFHTYSDNIEHCISSIAAVSPADDDSMSLQSRVCKWAFALRKHMSGLVVEARLRRLQAEQIAACHKHRRNTGKLLIGFFSILLTIRIRSMV